MSEASAHKLAYIQETTRGVTPSPEPRFQRLPDTRTTLALTKDTLTTERLTGTRFPAEPRTGAQGISGDIPADLSYGPYDDFIASALQGGWVVSAGGDTIDLEIEGVPNAAVVVGGFFPTTNGSVTVESINAKEEKVVFLFNPNVGDDETYELFGLSLITIDDQDFQVTAYTDTEEDATVKAGDTRKSFSILREFGDLAGGEPFLLYTGCEVASWNLTAAANGLAKSTFTFFGRTMVGPSAAAPTGTTYKPELDTEPFDTFSGELKIDGVESLIVTDYNLTINNNHAPRFVVGADSSQDPSVGQSMVEGSITAYFEDSTLYKKFVNEESFAIELTLQDSDGNKMIVNLPNLKIGSGTQPDVTADGAITIPINFTAHFDEALGSHVSVRRIQPVAV